MTKIIQNSSLWSVWSKTRIAGRKDKRGHLDEISQSGRPEFVVVYDRRRVGKTYLISQHFGNGFAFKTAGLAEGTIAEQLAAFAVDLRASGSEHKGRPSSWVETFAWLRELLENDGATRSPETDHLMVFIDETPWFDTPRSGFKSAFEHFWNVWASSRPNLMLIACGSSTSWIVDKLLTGTGGLFDRVTHVIDLQPLTLPECRNYLDWKGLSYSDRQVVESYMVFGGIPYYLELCGFIRGYRDFTKRKKERIFQLIDPFTLFYLTFVEKKGLESWLGFLGSPAHSAWAGLAFEMACLAHVDLIKRDLGISGVQTSACAWRSVEVSPGAQIDLLIDRRDDVVNLCEMKYSDGTYLMTASDEESIRNKMAAFRVETKTRKAVHPVVVTLAGARHNAHYDSVILSEVRVSDWLEGGG